MKRIRGGVPPNDESQTIWNRSQSRWVSNRTMSTGSPTDGSRNSFLTTNGRVQRQHRAQYRTRRSSDSRFLVSFMNTLNACFIRIHGAAIGAATVAPPLRRLRELRAPPRGRHGAG